MAKKKLLIAAVIVGLFAAGLVYLAIDKQNDQVETLLENQVKVVKAARNIPQGTPLKKDHITVDKVPKKFLPHNVLLKSDLSYYLDQPLKKDVKEGKMIVTGDFEVEEVANNLAAKIPEKERAMSMPVDNISGVSGLLRPGDRVDIIGTFPTGSQEQVIPEAGGGSSVGYITMTLLQNVTLLAVGQDIQSNAGENGNNSYNSVTLSVTVEEAELLTIAQTRGELELLLRHPEDVDIEPIKRKTLREVLEDLEVINKARKERQKEQEPAPTPTPTPTPDKKKEEDSLEIIRGDQRGN
jgi:pilus assembly protein CpaB